MAEQWPCLANRSFQSLESAKRIYQNVDVVSQHQPEKLPCPTLPKKQQSPSYPPVLHVIYVYSQNVCIMCITLYTKSKYRNQFSCSETFQTFPQTKYLSLIFSIGFPDTVHFHGESSFGLLEIRTNSRA